MPAVLKALRWVCGTLVCSSLNANCASLSTMDTMARTRGQLKVEDSTYSHHQLKLSALQVWTRGEGLTCFKSLMTCTQWPGLDKVGMKLHGMAKFTICTSWKNVRLFKQAMNYHIDKDMEGPCPSWAVITGYHRSPTSGVTWESASTQADIPHSQWHVAWHPCNCIQQLAESS